LKELIQVTEELLVLSEKMISEYKSRRESGEKGDFYTEVKPFADEVKEKNDRWKDLSLDWIKDTKPKHIHLPQILNTFDNIEMLSVHCFFPESSYNRFISHFQSVSYVLGTELDELKEK
jgi:Bacterial domain of unknown function (DUF1798)